MGSIEILTFEADRPVIWVVHSSTQALACSKVALSVGIAAVVKATLELAHFSKIGSIAHAATVWVFHAAPAVAAAVVEAVTYQFQERADTKVGE